MFQFQAARNMFHKRPEEAIQTLDTAIAGTEQAITESQNAIEDLRSEPIPQKDLAELVRAMGNELWSSQNAGGTSPVFDVIVEGERRTLLPLIQNEVYRIVREVLRNVPGTQGPIGSKPRLYRQKFWRKANRPDIGGCPGSGNERSASEQS